jgi:hypothetical protein
MELKEVLNINKIKYKIKIIRCIDKWKDINKNGINLREILIIKYKIVRNVIEIWNKK